MAHLRAHPPVFGRLRPAGDGHGEVVAVGELTAVRCEEWRRQRVVQGNSAYVGVVEPSRRLPLVVRYRFMGLPRAPKRSRTIKRLLTAGDAPICRDCMVQLLSLEVDTSVISPDRTPLATLHIF